MDFGNQLSKLRKRKNIKQTELAEMLNVRQYVISCWETGRSEPSLEQLSLLGDILNVSTDYLLGKEIIRCDNEEMFIRTIENMQRDIEEDYLNKIKELSNNLSNEKKEKLVSTVSSIIEFSK